MKLKLFVIIMCMLSNPLLYAQDLNNTKVENLKKDAVSTWDTIYLYDEIGLYKRHYLTFDEINEIVSSISQIYANNIWINDDEVLNERPQNDMLISTYYRWTNNNRNPIWKNTVVYENVNIKEYIQEIWKNNNWENSIKRTYTFNENNQVIESKNYYWKNNDWFFDEKVVNKFDINSNLIETISDCYRLNKFFKTVYTYVDNLIQMESNLTKVDSIWDLQKKITYEYDLSLNLIQKTYFEKFDSITNHNCKTEYLYNNDNNEIQSISFDYIDSTWIYRNKKNNFYTNLILQYYYTQNWNTLTNQWENSTKFEYSYNDNNKIEEELFYIWSNNQWKNNYRKNYTFDENNNNLTGNIEKWLNNKWSPTTSYFMNIYYNNGQNYMSIGNTHKYSVTHRNIAMNIENTKDLEDFKISPNPVIDYVNIKFPSCKKSNIIVNIIDAYGRILKSNNYINQDDININLSDIPLGINFIQIKYNNKNITKTILKMEF